MADSNKDFMLKRAQNAVLARDFVLAARLFKTVLKENPRDVEVLSKLGSTYVRAGEDENALFVYKQILQIDNTDFNALNNLGGIYRRLARYEESVLVLERALTTGTNTNEVYYNLGHTYKLMGNYDDAADCFVTVIEENPTDVLAYNHLGSIQAARGEHAKALQSYNKALQIDKNHPILHYNSALSYIALGKLEQAKLSFENALRTRPGWVEAMVDYADLLIGMNKNKEAQDLLTQAQKLKSEDINILNTLGKLNFKRKDYSMAEQNYLAVLAKNSEDYRALTGMALVYEKQRKLLDSQNLFEKLEQFDIDNSDIVLQHARVLLKLNEYEKAYSRINKICQNSPNDCEALNLLAQYYIYTKDETRKNACFKRINDTNPKYINHFLDCAEVYIDMGDFSSGEILLTQYLTKRRNDTEALMIMASLNEATHNYSTALQIYRRIFELEPQNAKILETINRLSQNISFNDVSKPLPEYLNPVYTQDDIDDEDISDDNEEIEEEIEFSSNEDDKMIFNLDNMSDKEDLPPEPLEFITEKEKEPLDFSNMDDRDTTITTLDDLVDLDEPIDINPATENDPLFDELASSKDEQIPLLEDEDIIDIADDKGELYIGADNEEKYDNNENQSYPSQNNSSIPSNYGSPIANTENSDDKKLNFADEEVKPEEDFIQSEEELDLDKNLPSDPVPEESEIENSNFEPEPNYSSNFDENSDMDSNFNEDSDLESNLQDLPEVNSEEVSNENSNPCSSEGLQGVNQSENACSENSSIDSELPIDANSETTEEIEDSENSTVADNSGAKSSLQNLVQSLQDALVAKKYANTSELFDVLDELCSYLPDSIKDNYLSSLDRLRLEYLRSKMSGKPGLMAIVEELRKKHPEEFAEFDETKELTEEMIIKTFIYMNTLTKELPDKNISSLLGKHLDQAIRTIRD